MWRYLAGGVAALLLVAAGVLLFKSPARSDSPLPAAPIAVARQLDDRLPDTVPEASAKTREEYLAPRRKAFAKLDVNGDGKLSFEEWAMKTMTKFTEADKDKSGAMTAAEFATTAPKRKAQRPRTPCPPAGAKPEPEDS